MISRDQRYCVVFSKDNGARVSQLRSALLHAKPGEMYLIGCWMEAHLAHRITKRLLRADSDIGYLLALHDGLSGANRTDADARQRVNGMLTLIEHEIIESRKTTAIIRPPVGRINSLRLAS